MKSEALWIHSRGLALVDFGRDPRSGESWTAMRNFVFFCQVSNTQFYRFPVGQISRNLNTTGRPVSRWILSEQTFGNFPVMGRFFRQNLKNLRIFQCLATSGRHNSAMNIDRRKYIAKWSLYGESFHFYRWTQFKVISLTCTLRTRNFPKFSATSDACWRHGT